MYLQQSNDSETNSDKKHSHNSKENIATPSKAPIPQLRNLGFIGIGTMGEAMSLRLLQAGSSLLIWNRTAERTRALVSAGAELAKSAAEVFARTEIVILMLFDSEALDAVLGRGTPEFADMVKGRTVVHMGTTSPSHSRKLEAELHLAGACYVEAPVSGTRKPAEIGQLVCMLAGRAETVDIVRPILAPMCRTVISCGPVPNALSMKLASNMFVITMVTGLAEAINYVARQGIDLNQFASFLDAGQLSSELLRIKAVKMISRDFLVQGSIANVLESQRLITEAAREAEIAVPLLETCHTLYLEAADLGFVDEDIAAVLHAIESRSKQQVP